MRNTKQSYRFPMLWLLTGIVVSLIAFAAVFEIDQAVRAQGQVIPGSRTQVIQAVDGGMLTALYVKEGDTVKRGQRLAELEPDRAVAQFDQSAAEVSSKKIALIRARAELVGQEPIYGPEFSSFSSFVTAQLGIYKQRKQSLDEEILVMEQAMKLAQDELAMNQRLYANGDISKTEVMRLERQVLDIQVRISGTKNKYMQETRSEIAKLEDDLSSSRYKQDERKNTLEHTNLDSPMDGVIKYVRITTVGGVLKPGDELMQISPVDDEMVVELRINPADVGQLRVGLPVTLRFDAFDSNIYGNVDGVLKYISPDTLSEQGGNGQNITYYRAHVSIDWSLTTSHAIKKIISTDIRPGLTVTADVLTGQRTILNYIMKPITRAFSGALTQH